MNGANLLVETLQRAGVTTIFSLSGNQIMPVYDACLDAGIRIVHTRHENAAVYMADAWAQVTGEIGVALVTAAPGFANALSALYSAKTDEVPLLLLSGDSPVGADGSGAFQELDQVAMSAPITKMSVRPVSTLALARDVAEAIKLARSGRPGPVHVALAADVLLAETGSELLPEASAMEPESVELDPGQMLAISEALKGAERPLILTGPLLNPGRAKALFARLERATGAPVLCLESPRGLRDPALGAFAEVLAEADLIVSLGKVIDFTLGFARPPSVAATARFVVVDTDPAALARADRLAAGRPLLTVEADPRWMAEMLAAAGPAEPRPQWCEAVSAAVGYRGNDSTAEGVHPRALCAVVQKVLDGADDAILCIDGGEFGQWSQALLNAPQRIINGVSGAIGGGICHAIAAKLARPEATVIVLMGDGTAGFHLAEFETAAREGANIVAIVGNDARWNAEHQIQLRDYGEDRAHSCEILPEARYDSAAVALGCHGARVVVEADFEPALHAALASGKPACLDVAIASLAAPTFRRKG